MRTPLYLSILAVVLCTGCPPNISGEAHLSNLDANVTPGTLDVYHWNVDGLLVEDMTGVPVGDDFDLTDPVHDDKAPPAAIMFGATLTPDGAESIDVVCDYTDPSSDDVDRYFYFQFGGSVCISEPYSETETLPGGVWHSAKLP